MDKISLKLQERLVQICIDFINEYKDDEQVKQIHMVEFTDIIANKPVLQIYNHHDGYPDHLGTVLNKYYNDYERALALILAGDTSFVDQHSTKAYASRPDEGYESNKPVVLDHSRVNEEYLYTFTDGKWIMR